MRNWHLDTAQAFLADTEAEFAFLADFGFHLTRAEQLPLPDFPRRRIPIVEQDTPLERCVVAIQFDSDSVELSIYHHPAAEVSLTVRHKSAERSVDLYHVLRIAAPESAPKLPDVYSSSTTAPREVLAQMAALAQAHAGPWLRGDPSAFARAIQTRTDPSAA